MIVLALALVLFAWGSTLALDSVMASSGVGVGVAVLVFTVVVLLVAGGGGIVGSAVAMCFTILSIMGNKRCASVCVFAKMSHPYRAHTGPTQGPHRAHMRNPA